MKGLRVLLVVLGLSVFSGISMSPVSAADCQFVLGFRTLHDLIPDIVGDCVMNEHHNRLNGDGLQETVSPKGIPGLMVWRKADNWTAFTDGSTTWIIGPNGLQSRPNNLRFPWEAGAKPAASSPPPAVVPDEALCGQLPVLMEAVDWTLETRPPAQQENVDEENLASLRYLRNLVEADNEWCSQLHKTNPFDPQLEAVRGHFVTASEALRTYQADVRTNQDQFAETPGSGGQPDGTAPVMALLSKVRMATHAGFDRIVLEFEGALPEHRVEYIDAPVRYDASGEQVPIGGSAFLRVRFRPSSGYDADRGQRTYPGPTEIAPGLPVLREVWQTGDFEGTLSWVLGLSRRADFRIVPLSSPTRLVIDVIH